VILHLPTLLVLLLPWSHTLLLLLLLWERLLVTQG
jgi:hypothetical protein